MSASRSTSLETEPVNSLLNQLCVCEPTTMTSTWCSCAAEMIAAGQLELDPLISRVIPLEKLPAELAAEPRLGDVKVMVQPNG